jgi:hypothetical protein
MGLWKRVGSVKGWQTPDPTIGLEHYLCAPVSRFHDLLRYGEKRFDKIGLDANRSLMECEELIECLKHCLRRLLYILD